MNIREILEVIDSEKVMNTIAMNEISGNEKVICKFSYAGGISGYSFGRSQFDVKHNENARKFLKEKCGFSDEDIARLLRLEKNVLDLNAKLEKHRKDIDELDKKHIEDMIRHVASLEKLPEMENERVFVHLVDYHNQFNMSKNGKLHLWLKDREYITADDILKFKLRLTKWGLEHPEDVKRRWNNIERFYDN